MSALGDFLAEVIWRISWQTAALAVVIWLITRVARRAPASWRHALWLVVVIKLFIPPFAQLPAELALWETERPAVTQSVMVTKSGPGARASLPRPSSAEPRFLPPTTGPLVTQVRHTAGPHAKDILAVAWMMGFLAMFTLLLLRLLRQGRLIRGSVPASEEISNLLERSAASLGMRRLPKPRTSPEAKTPMLMGLWRPMIVLPSSIMNSCTESELRAMLLHEMAHVKRLDLVSIWMHQLAQLLFFFHPAVWLAGLQLKLERELACDELVLSASAITPSQYAAGYVSALKLARSGYGTATALAMIEPFELERRRLDMIFRNSMPRLSVGWVMALVLIAGIGFPTFAGVAQRGSTVPLRAGVDPLTNAMRSTKSTNQAAHSAENRATGQIPQRSQITDPLEREAPAVAVPEKQSSQAVKQTTAKEELDWILQGRRRALKSIHSGKGSAVLHFLHQRTDGITETDASYDIAFIDDKFRESHETTFLQNGPADGRRYPPGSRRSYQASYDGKKAVSYDHTNQSCVISESPDASEQRTHSMLVREPLNRFMDVDNIDTLYSRDAVEKTGLRVDRREILNGDECVVLQLSWIASSKDESRVFWTWEFWVSPSKGFTLPKAVGSAQGGWFGEKRHVIAEFDTQVRRQRDGTWVPARLTSLNYLIDKEGRSSLGVKYTITFDPGFQFNVPVADADLKITLPAGTHVDDTVLDAIYQVERPRTVLNTDEWLPGDDPAPPKPGHWRG